MDNALDALKALVNAPSSKAMLGWPCLIEPTPDAELIAVRNGLLHIPSRDLLPHDPRFFTAGSVNVTFDPNALAPVMWLKFLHEAFTDDQESIDVLSSGYRTCVILQTRSLIWSGWSGSKHIVMVRLFSLYYPQQSTHRQQSAVRRKPTM